MKVKAESESSVQLLSHVRLFATPWTTVHQASLSITNSRSPPKPMSIKLVMLSNHLILCRPFSFCPQSFPTSGSFPMSQLFASGAQESEKAHLKLNIQKTKIMASGPITTWQIDGETMETVTDFLFLGSKIIVDGDCSHKIKRCLLLGRKAMIN